MLKVGNAYTPKKKVFISKTISQTETLHDYILPGEIFTVLKYTTDEEEEDEFADYVILFKNQTYDLSRKIENWKAVAYDFEVVC